MSYCCQNAVIGGPNNDAIISFSNISVQNDGNVYIYCHCKKLYPEQYNNSGGYVIDTDQTWNTAFRTLAHDVLITNCATLTSRKQHKYGISEENSGFTM